MIERGLYRNGDSQTAGPTHLIGRNQLGMLDSMAVVWSGVLSQDSLVGLQGLFDGAVPYRVDRNLQTLPVAAAEEVQECPVAEVQRPMGFGPVMVGFQQASGMRGERAIEAAGNAPTDSWQVEAKNALHISGLVVHNEVWSPTHPAVQQDTQAGVVYRQSPVERVHSGEAGSQGLLASRGDVAREADLVSEEQVGLRGDKRVRLTREGVPAVRRRDCDRFLPRWEATRFSGRRGC